MNAFWKWLMKTNARAVCLVSILALAGVIAFWVWMLSSPIENIAMLPSSSRGGAEAKGGLAVLSYIESMLASDVRPARNPFVSGFRTERTPPDQHAGAEVTVVPVRNQSAVPEVKLVPAVKVAPTAEAKAPHPPAPGPVSRSVSLTYRGMYRQSDGRIMVLVEDSESKSSVFYGTEVSVFGMKIGSVAAESVELLPEEGQAVTLQRGEPAVFNGIQDK